MSSFKKIYRASIYQAGIFKAGVWRGRALKDSAPAITYRPRRGSDTEVENLMRREICSSKPTMLNRRLNESESARRRPQ